MSALLRQAIAALHARTTRRLGVPDELQVPRVALVWAAVAVGLAVGGATAGPARVAAALLALAVAATRPGRLRLDHPLVALHSARRAVVWVLLAAAVLLGGVRTAAIDASAAPVAEREVAGAEVLLLEPLASTTGPRSPAALGQLDGQKIQLVAPRFGDRPIAVPRGGMAAVDGKVVALGGRPGDQRLRRQGVAGRLLAAEMRPLASRRGGVFGALDRFAAAAERQLVDALGARRGTLVAGMALGTADGISEPDAAALRTSGLWHLVAASGGNIALVVALVFALGWLLGAGDRTRLLVAAVAVCLYVPLAGAGPSIQRAGVMGLAGLLALALGREHRGLTALALAAAATLALDPRAWLDVGWQLSFAAAGGLITVGPWAARALSSYGLPRFLSAGLACTVIATVATAPIMLATFGELSLIGLVANALVLPCVGVVVWSGALSAVLTPVAPAVAGLVAAPAGIGAGITLAVAGWASARTHAVVGLTEVVALIVAIGLLAVVRPPPIAARGILITALGLLVWSVPRPPSEPRLVIFDIGQGNASLLQDGTDGVLVDAGPADAGLVGLLRKTGVRRLRAVVLSHPAADHDGGAAAVLDAFPTDVLLDGGEPGGGPTHDAALRVAQRRDIPIAPVRAGQRLHFGRVALRVRWPTAPATRKPGDPNDRAAVIEARIGRLDALLPADAEGGVLRAIPNLKPTGVLVVSHHGSSDEHLPAVLQRVRPQLGVISLGAQNTYGHPTPDTIEALRAARTPTLRTDQAGTLDLRAGADGRVAIRRSR